MGRLWAVRPSAESQSGKQLVYPGRGPILVGGPKDPDPPPPPVGNRFAGDQGRLLLGMACPESGIRPNTSEAVQILGVPVYERRIFSPKEISLPVLQSLLNDAWATNSALPGSPGRVKPYAVASFKHPNGSFFTGSSDGALDIIVNHAKNVLRPAGLKVCLSNRHEPVAGANYAFLTAWGKDHMYIAKYLDGWRGHANGQTGTRFPALSVSDTVAWAAIMNGFVWGPSRGNRDDQAINAAMPPELVAVFRDSGDIVMADFYDSNPPNYDTAVTNWKNGGKPTSGPLWQAILTALDYPQPKATADRTYRKLQSFTDWADSLNSGPIGAGEFCTVDLPGLTEVRNFLMSRLDKWVIANYFNSGANSRYEWRMLMENYPAYNSGTNTDGVPDMGGNRVTEQRLLYMRNTFLPDSLALAA